MNNAQARSATMPRPTARSSIFTLLGTRLGVVVTTGLYALTLFTAHANYLSMKWDYFGFTYASPNPAEFLFMAALVAAVSMFVPLRLDRPSSGALWILYAVVVIPTCVITCNLHDGAVMEYGLSLACLAGGFSLACLIARRARPAEFDFALPPESFDRLVLALWGISLVAIILTYGRLMTFASLTDMYIQRQIFTDATSGVVSYVISHFTAVFCPALFVLGLFRKKYWLSALGALGFIVVYSAVASKASLAMPVVLGILYFLFTRRTDGLRTTGFLTGALCLPMAALLVIEQLQVVNVEFLLDILVFRTVAIPGLTFSQYHDYFGTFGHTFWSNVRGLDLVVPAPSSLANDASWPDLGRMVGAYYYGDYRIQANANLFSGEGVAAAGAIGVLVVSVVLGSWLRVLDFLTKRWDYRFGFIVLFPVFNSLTNSHLSTTQTSFGGAFWLLLLLVYTSRLGRAGVPR